MKHAERIVAPVESSPLTRRMLDCLQAIRSLTQSNGYPPSIREIADHAGVPSTSTVHETPEELGARGLIARNPRQSRTLTITEAGLQYRGWTV